MMRRRYSSPVIVLLNERFALAIKSPSSFACVSDVCVENCGSASSASSCCLELGPYWSRRGAVALISTLDRAHSKRRTCKNLDRRRWNLSEPVRRWDNSPCKSRRIGERDGYSPVWLRHAARRSDRRDWRRRDTSVEFLSTIDWWAERTRKILRSPEKRRSRSVPERTEWSVGKLEQRRADNHCWRCIRNGVECVEKRCRASLRSDR